MGNFFSNLLSNRQLPYVIAEAGVNHNGELEIALDLLKQAVLAGVDCIKFQAFSADELITKDTKKLEYQKQTGRKNETQYEMLKRLELTRPEFVQIKKQADKLGIDFLVTPFSISWAKFLREIGVWGYKVGSGNLNAIYLLEYLAETHLPIIASTGMSSLSEIDLMLDIFKRKNSNDISILQCTSLYPAHFPQLNLNVINVLREHTKLPVGFSDHTSDIRTGGLAVAAGAVILEKHFTLSRNMEGPDHKSSTGPRGMKEYVEFSRAAYSALGNGEKNIFEEELIIKNLVGFSLSAAVDIEAQSSITLDMLTEKRPASGISPMDREKVIGKKTKEFISKGQIIEWNMLN